MNPGISVIVPIYQSEATLQRCLDSIINQIFEDYELLLVNDGSSDKSMDICQEYQKTDSRVRIISKPHSGVSDARQMGIENAVGKYVIHCDSDDWMDPNMLEELYQTAQKTDADMVVCDYWVESKMRKKHSEFLRKFDSSLDISKQMLSLSFCVWNKLVRRSFIIQNNLHFLHSIYYAEDLFFTLQLLNSNPKISYIPYPLYHYDKQNVKSLTHNVSPECFESKKRVLISLSGCLNKSLEKKLNYFKFVFMCSSFKNNYLSFVDLLHIFPELHMLMIPLAFEYCKNKLTLSLQNWRFTLNKEAKFS